MFMDWWASGREVLAVLCFICESILESQVEENEDMYIERGRTIQRVG
jgi:hypothetical protein